MAQGKGIGGWKTKTGLITMAIGGALVAAAQFAPDDNIKTWCLFIGTLLATFGGSFGGYGIAAKVVKHGNGSGMAKNIPLIIFVMVMAPLLLSACSATGAYQTYAIVDQQFTNAITKYNLQYEDASVPVQNSWRKKIDPVIIQASRALDLWRVALDGSAADAPQKQQAFLLLKDQLFNILISEKILKIKEE